MLSSRTTRITLIIFLASSVSVVREVLGEDPASNSGSSEEKMAPDKEEGDQARLSPAEILAAKGELEPRLPRV